MCDTNQQKPVFALCPVVTAFSALIPVSVTVLNIFRLPLPNNSEIVEYYVLFREFLQ